MPSNQLRASCRSSIRNAGVLIATGILSMQAGAEEARDGDGGDKTRKPDGMSGRSRLTAQEEGRQGSDGQHQGDGRHRAQHGTVLSAERPVTGQRVAEDRSGAHEVRDAPRGGVSRSRRHGPPDHGRGDQ